MLIISMAYSLIVFTLALWDSGIDFKVQVDSSVVSNIVSRCEEVDSGARNIQKIINQSLLPELSEHFLHAMIGEQEIEDMKISYKSGSLIFDKG